MALTHTQMIMARMQLAQALDSYEAALDQFTTLLTRSDLPHWLALGGDRQALADAFAQVDYVEDQPGNDALLFVGLAAVDRDTARAAVAFNAAKQELRTVLTPMADLFWPGPNGPEPLARHALRALGRGRLHPLQAWRQIEVLPQRPLQVGYCWCRSTKVQRRTAAEERIRAERLGLHEEAAQLAALPPDTPLARVRPVPPHPRANLVYADGTRRQVRAVLPILYTDPSGMPLPRHQGPGPCAIRERLPRLDRRIEPDVWLPALHLHRYRQD